MYNPSKLEPEILEFWKTNTIFDKLRKKNKGRKSWSFIDGPITANNPMGVHHAWGRTYKDVFQRFKAMQGYNQRFQNGFDCQGLWIEREAEKELGLKDKKDIEKFGILNFVNACKARVEKFSKIQEQQSIRLGQWMDWENSYFTMTDNNNLHNWMLIKKYHKNGWLYKGNDSVPWCWRCGTASSKHDIITEGYKEVTHTALFMQFPLKDRKNEYFLIFTTTAWTVPANVAIAVNKDIDYVKIKQEGKLFWLAKSRLSELKGDFKIIETKKGKQLENIRYEMPYKDLPEQANAPHKVVLWKLASEMEGTGIVHIAPGCGKEDHDLGKKLNFPAISPLDESGVYRDNFGKFSNKKYSEVNNEVLQDLEERGFVYKTENYKHRYPHCWRCGQELVFRLVDEWYVKCREIRPILIKENKKIKWSPEYGKARQEEWFKNMDDWLISRKRYWGLPLPIWECACSHLEVIGSLKELKEKAIDKKQVKSLPELHRPWIDEIKIKCIKCHKEISRIKDVGDAWLDAGIVPFSTLNYLNYKSFWKKWFPADFISENMPGQYRGWFNALFWASIALTGKAPFKSILGYETLKDEKGEEMHKSKGNAIWFEDAVEKMGADPMRLLYCLQDPSQELRFGFNVIREPRNNLNILYNMSNLIENINLAEIGEYVIEVEDKWIISRFNTLVQKVTQELENLHPDLATKALQDFWLDDLSRGYIQFVRDRLPVSNNASAFTLASIYLGLLKLCSPVTPFIAEYIYQGIRAKLKTKEESIHLFAWPETDKKLIDKKLEINLSVAREIMTLILYEREKAKLNVRWPLRQAIIYTADIKTLKGLEELIKRHTNIKDIVIKQGESKVELDTNITPELEQEGYARELTRKIQALRKKAGLTKEDKVNIAIITQYDLGKWLKEIAVKVGAKSLRTGLPEEKYSIYSREAVTEVIKGIYFEIYLDA